MRLLSRCAAVIGLCVAVVAASAEPIEPELLDRLDAASWTQREAASAELLGQDGPPPERIAESLPPAGERPEVRARLLAVLHHRFLTAFRESLAPARPGDAGLVERAGRAALGELTPGSLGVSHRAFPAGAIPGVEEPSIAVVRTLPGFPAHAVLREGDLIVGLNGRPVAWDDPAAGQPVDRRRRVDAGQREAAAASQAAAAFSRAVQNAGAGSTVLLRVVRGSERIEVPVTLARADALRRMYPGGGLAPADAAWAAHLADLEAAAAR